MTFRVTVLRDLTPRPEAMTQMRFAKDRDASTLPQLRFVAAPLSLRKAT